MLNKVYFLFYLSPYYPFFTLLNKIKNQEYNVWYFSKRLILINTKINKKHTYINKISNTLKIYFSFFFKVNKNLLNSFEYFLFTKVLNPLLEQFKLFIIIILTKTRKTKLNIFFFSNKPFFYKFTKLSMI